MCSSIFKTVATSCHLLRLKCIKFDFGWGSAPDSALPCLQRSPIDPITGFEGPTSKGRERKERKGKGGEEPL